MAYAHKGDYATAIADETTAIGLNPKDTVAYLGGHATLRIENAALSNHVFANQIDFFAKSDAFDLRGLKFHAGAKAKYDPASHLLRVNSGHATDVLTLLSPHGTHFAAARQSG